MYELDTSLDVSSSILILYSSIQISSHTLILPTYSSSSYIWMNNANYTGYSYYYYYHHHHHFYRLILLPSLLLSFFHPFPLSSSPSPSPILPLSLLYATSPTLPHGHESIRSLSFPFFFVIPTIHEIPLFLFLSRYREW